MTWHKRHEREYGVEDYNVLIQQLVSKCRYERTLTREGLLESLIDSINVVKHMLLLPRYRKPLTARRIAGSRVLLLLMIPINDI